MSDSKFAADYSKRLSKCAKCKKEIPKGDVRLAKVVPNFFSSDGGSDDMMKQYHHIECLFDSFRRAKATTKIIESCDEIQGFTELEKTEKDKIVKAIKCFFLNFKLLKKN
jgi:DNA ligase-3